MTTVGGTMLRTTDPDIAVYRPWVWLSFPFLPGLDPDFKINYPKGVDEKFRWLKDFRWSIGDNHGVSVEFTIYEDRASYNQFWPYLILESLTNGAATAGRNPSTVYFQWGYAGRTPDGTGVGGFPGSFATEHCSDVHVGYIHRMETEYAEGGMNYKFVAQDAFASTGQVTKYGNQKTRLDTAIKEKARQLSRAGILPPDFAQHIKFDQAFSRWCLDPKSPRDWPDSGLPFMATVHEWLLSAFPENNLTKEDYNKVAPRILAVDIRGKEGLLFTLNIQQTAPLFIIHVNPPESENPLGLGRHTAISIRPELDFSKLTAVYPQPSTIDHQFFRGVLHADKFGPEGQNNVGTPTPMPAPSTDDSVTTPQKQQGIGTAAAGGVILRASNIDIELLGMPNLDNPMIYASNNLVWLYVWNTAYINDDLQWSRLGSLLDPRPYGKFFDPRFTGYYRISRMSHNISEGAYTTSLSLVPEVPAFRNNTL